VGKLGNPVTDVANEYISFVNARSYFEKLGIDVVENRDAKFTGYKSALKVVVEGRGTNKLSVGGIVFDDHYIRISLLNDFYFEVDPVGSILMIENHDRPGVIGDVGHFLAAEGVNIDTFALSRNKQGGMAMSLIRIDEDLKPEQLIKMREINNIVKVKGINL